LPISARATIECSARHGTTPRTCQNWLRGKPFRINVNCSGFILRPVRDFPLYLSLCLTMLESDVFCSRMTLCRSVQDCLLLHSQVVLCSGRENVLGLRPPSPVRMNPINTFALFFGSPGALCTFMSENVSELHHNLFSCLSRQ
jgi:hypothetical protein